jgi:uncharacterized protein
LAKPQLSRRTFIGGCAATAAAATAAYSASSSRAFAQTKPPAGKFIDVHTHIGQTWNHTEPLSAKALLEWMDQHEIAQACVLPLVSPESSGYLITVDYVLQETKPHRDRLIPFCCIDPRTSYTHGRNGLRYIIKKWVDAGARGFGEHKPGVAVDHPGNQEIYAVCNEFKLPLIFHLEGGKEPRNLDKPGLPALEAMLKAFPDVKFIGHGPGWWASISGDVTDLAGYPKTKTASGGAIDRLMDAYPNIYGDLSAGSGAGAMKRDLDFAAEFIKRRRDRLMFGTDYLSPGQGVPQFELYNKTLDLPADVQAKVFRDNARRVMGLA